MTHNRLSEMSGEGACSSRYSGGSISVTDIIKKLQRSAVMSLPHGVFTYIHTKNHDRVTFIDRSLELVRDNYTIGRERAISSQAQNVE
ncbi:hypothetical protein JCGZ_10736 [Jatropha curcas]|uniref:Uncharacterized protein n=1 Tax=Jatropha curcas TaxID=180498 RepID=A0A067LQX8_JATCU|nr:hypothetical protein JCGZ_10736 [Jatropha curcas]